MKNWMEYRTLKAKACIKRKTFYHVAITKFKIKPTNFKITLKKEKKKKINNNYLLYISKLLFFTNPKKVTKVLKHLRI
jgi:hypothetical protein